MEDHTIRLLQECSQGCKMGIKSINQVSEYVADQRLKRIIEKYRGEHQRVDAEIDRQLNGYGQDGKQPEMMASAMSWVSTEMKMLMKDDDKQAAKIMTEGCDMGIRTLCGVINQYPGASETSLSTAKELVNMEEQFREEMKPYL